MRLFDWRRREEQAKMVLPEGNLFELPGKRLSLKDCFFLCLDFNINLGNLFPIPGSRKRFKRVGRGIAAGQGKSCGRGMRGQKSRAGESIRQGFEGGQTPIHRRLPKYPTHTQNYHRREKYYLVQLASLNLFNDNELITPVNLREQGLLGKSIRKKMRYKLVGGAILEKTNLTVFAHGFTQSAKTSIEDQGGKCVVIEKFKRKLNDSVNEDRLGRIIYPLPILQEL
jgi:large subunit ribosomal protein L15